MGKFLLHAREIRVPKEGNFVEDGSSTALLGSALQCVDDNALHCITRHGCGHTCEFSECSLIVVDHAIS
jgi:hypothetical protein